jgi:hypothetical protein
VEYLLLALGLIIGGIAIVMFRNRRSTGIDASIEEFEQSLEAIKPPREPQRGRRSG